MVTIHLDADLRNVYARLSCKSASAGVAQLAEHLIRNQDVASPILVPSSRLNHVRNEAMSWADTAPTDATCWRTPPSWC